MTLKEANKVFKQGGKDKKEGTALRENGRCLGQFRFTFRGISYATYAKILTRKMFVDIDTDEKYNTYLKDNVIALGMRSQPLPVDSEKKNVKYKNEIQADIPTVHDMTTKKTEPYNSPCLNLKTYHSQSIVYVDGLSVSTPRNIKKVRCAFPYADNNGQLTQDNAVAELWVNLANNLAKDFGFQYLTLQDAAFTSLGYPKDMGSGGNAPKDNCPYGFPLSVLYLMEKGTFVYDKYGFNEVSISPVDIEDNRYTDAQQTVYLQRANENRTTLMSIASSYINEYFDKDDVNEKFIKLAAGKTPEQLVNIPGLRDFFDKCFENLLTGVSADNKTREFKNLAAFCVVYGGGYDQVLEKVNAARNRIAKTKEDAEKVFRDLGASPGERKSAQVKKDQDKLLEDAEKELESVFNDLFFRKTKENSEDSLGHVYMHMLNQLYNYSHHPQDNPTIGQFYRNALRRCTESPRDDTDYSQKRLNIVAYLVIEYIFNTKELWLLEEYVNKVDRAYVEHACIKARNRYNAWVGSYRGFKKAVTYNDLHITSSAFFPCKRMFVEYKDDLEEKYRFLCYWNKAECDPAQGSSLRNSGVMCTNYNNIYRGWKDLLKNYR